MYSFALSLPKDTGERIDCEYHNPETIKKMEELQKLKSHRKTFSPVKKVVKVTYGKRLPKGTLHSQTDRDIIPFIRGGDVKNNKVNFDNCARISPEIYEVLVGHYLKQWDMAITIVGTIGETGLVEDYVDVCAISDNLASLRVKEDVSSEFITLFMNSELGKLQTNRYSVGSLQFKLSLKNLKSNINVLMPCNEAKEFDLQEQNRLVEIYRKYEQEATKKLNEYYNKLSQYKQVFVDFFKIDLPSDIEDSETFVVELKKNTEERIDSLYNNPKRKRLQASLKSKKYRLLGTLVEIQKKGVIFPSSFYRLIELDDIDEGLGEIRNVQEVVELRSEKIVFRENEILVAKLQPEKGKVIIVDKEHEGCLGSSELVPLKRISEEVTNRYLYHMLRSPYVSKQWEYCITGCSRERIGRKEIATTIIPMVDVNLQNELTNKLDALQSEAKMLLEEQKNLKRIAETEFLNALVKEN